MKGMREVKIEDLYDMDLPWFIVRGVLSDFGFSEVKELNLEGTFQSEGSLLRSSQFTKESKKEELTLIKKTLMRIKDLFNCNVVNI